jgi:hypothetical protein
MLNEFVGDRIILKRLWPPRSSDFFCAFLRKGMYQNSSRSIQQQKTNIENAISCILGDSQKMVKRLECNEKNAGHFSLF